VVDSQDPRTPRIAIADSAVSFVRSALKADLADRYVPVQMHPLSFAEWLELRSVLGLPAPPPGDEVAMLRECREYLWLGGFPEHATRRDELYAVREALLQMVVDQAIRDDIGRLLGLRELDALERLFVARLAESGAQLNLAQAAASAGVSGPTARHWLRAMCDTGLLWELPLHVRSAGKFERAQPKLYSVDPSLVGACAIPVFGREDATLDGRAVETAVAQALRVYCQPPERQRRLSVHQSRTKGAGTEDEIDFIVEEGASTFAIEVTRRRDVKKLNKLVQTGRGVEATWFGVVSLERLRREETTVDGERVHQIPLAEFLLGLARSDSRWPW
jgi:predicted AAA+ superfamily ATPase